MVGRCLVGLGILEVVPLKELKAIAVSSDSARFSRLLRSAILWPICVILFTAALMVFLIIMLLKVVKWSEHSYEVIAQTRACESTLLDAESELRGYLLTGSNDFPSSFRSQRIEVNEAFHKLVSLVSDNPQQQIRAEGLVRTKDLWFAHAVAVLDQQTKAAQSPDWIKMGDALTDDLRGQFQKFIEIEENLHDERLQHVDSVKRAIGFAGGALALILALTVGQLVRRQFIQLDVDYRSALRTIEQRHAELVRSEADLEEQKEWFRVTLTSIGDGVIVTDRENRIVFMNHESERLTGWNSVEALLKPLSTVFRVIDEKTREKEDPAALALREKKKSGLPSPAILLSKNGGEWPIDDSSAPILDGKGNVLGLVLVFRNATDTRRAQNQLRVHSEELEKRVDERTLALQQTVSELEAFSYTVSHDLRSPLRAMQGFSQALLEDYGDKLDEQAKNYLQRIKNAAERLDRLIQDLLSYTRISRKNYTLVPLDLDKLIHELVQHYPNLHPPAADVKIQGVLPHVVGQESLLTQVFSNLLGNAAKFVANGTSPLIHVWSEDLGDRVRIWTEDNGIGIPAEDHEKIFQMFVQVSESQLYGGTGVGLAIAKKAVESMHGTVGVVPGGNGGSRFWVELAKAA